MTSAFWVDPPHLKKTAPEFEDVGKAVADIQQRLQGKLDAEGKCWGGDDYGKGFEEKYDDPKKQADDYFKSLAKEITRIGTGLEEMADTYGKGDEASNKF
jgi:uncharacterized protein YukE